MSSDLKNTLRIVSFATWAQCIPFLSTLVWLCEALVCLVWPARLAAAEVEQAPLFPLILEVLEHDELPATQAQPCLTGLTTRLLPFKNQRGEIEWALTDDVQGHELEAFRMPPQEYRQVSEHVLSPVTLNSSNNELILSDKKDMANTPLSTTSDDLKTEDFDEEGGVHQCPHCKLSFRMRGYLTRHLKKHAEKKAYKCPFHLQLMYKDDQNVAHFCHPLGGFSRRDTYKTHLKSRHFQYPKGTPLKERAKLPGLCKMCGEWFENGEMWCEIHIEGGECKHLPPGFKGKLRIKIRLKKQMMRMMKEQQQQLKRNLPAQPLPAALPVPGSQIVVPVHPQAFAPHVGAPIGCPPLQAAASTPSANGQTPQMSTPVSIPTPFLGSPFQREDDYDDDFCLDTEQLVELTYNTHYMGSPGFLPMVLPFVS